MTSSTLLLTVTIGFLILVEVVLGAEVQTQSNCRTTAGYSTDEEEVDQFNVECLVASTVYPDYVHKGEDAMCGLTVKWKVCGRLNTLKEPIVYDALAETSLTSDDVRFLAVVRQFDSYEDALATAKLSLNDLLSKKGIIHDIPCQVGPYSRSVANVNGLCPPNSNVSACTECPFECVDPNQQDYGKKVTLRCCGNGFFDGKMLECAGGSVKKPKMKGQ